MINRATFEALYRVWLEGALPPVEAAEMAEYCRVHPDVRDSADAERAFDLRIRDALIAGEDARGIVAAAIARARAAGSATATATERRAAGGGVSERIEQRSPASTASPASIGPRGRLLRPRRWAGISAAAAALVAGFMWFNCVPPFECPLLQAMERSADTPADGTGELCGNACETVPADWACGCTIKRTRVPVGAGIGASEAVVLLCPTDGHKPSFRRAREIAGTRWWVAQEHGRTIVAFEDPETGGLWCFVGEADEETLLAAATAFRVNLRGRSN